MRVPTHTAQAGHEDGSGTNRRELPASLPPYPLTRVRWSVHSVSGVSNVSVGSGICVAFGSQAHLSTSAPCRARTVTPGIRPVIHLPSGRRSRSYGLRFPVDFRLPAFASWTPCPAGTSAPITVGLPPQTALADPRRTQSGFTTFHTRETRTGWGALFTPGTTVFTGHRCVRGRRLPLLNGESLSSRHSVPTREVGVMRHRQEFPVSRPSVLPLACDRPGWDSGP